MSKKINIKQPASVQRAAQEMNPADALVDSISRRERPAGKRNEEIDHRKKPVEELRSEKGFFQSLSKLTAICALWLLIMVIVLMKW